MTATAAPAGSRVSGASSPGFGSALASEWTKLRSVRSTWIVVALMIVLPIGFSTLIAWVQGMTFEDWGPAEQATFDPIVNSTVGILFGIILLIVFSVLPVTSEYGSRMIRTTLIVTPQRLRVFAAKALIVGLIGIVLAAISGLGMFFASQAIFSSYGMESVTIGDEGVNRFLLVYTLGVGLLYTLIPFSLAFLLRGTASAITVSIALFFLPWMFSPLLPTWIQENVVRYFPDIALDSLAGITAADSTMYLSQGPAVLTMTLWIIASLVLAAVMLTRRDA
jgi:ABC-2 type transport system permease protein